MDIYIAENLSKASDELYESLLAKLPKWRLSKALSFKNRTERLNSAVTYLLLCRILDENYGIKNPPEFVLGTHEKPYLRNYPDLFFNMSHCRNAVASVVAEFSIGLDVLDNRKINEGIAAKICTPSEIEAFEASDDKQSFLRKIWSTKESYSKMTGHGYSEGYTTIETESFGENLFFMQKEDYCISLYSDRVIQKPNIEIIPLEKI